MKKIICLSISILVFVSPFFAKKRDAPFVDPNQNYEEDDAEVINSGWRESGKNALEATGQFLKDVGSTLEEKLDNATEVKCYGTWVYKTDNVTTTFICNKDGTMEISKKVYKDTDYWKGTFTAALRTLTFKITESGRKGAFLKNAKADMETSWTITYFIEEAGKSIKIYSGSIPTDIDGTDFSKGIIFTKVN